jgi:sortase B
MKKTWKVALAAAVAVLVLGGSAAGALYFFDQDKAVQIEEKKEKAEPEQAEKDYNAMQGDIVAKAEDPYQSKINFEELQKVNADAYAWIQIPGTNVDYPILQSATEADDYYLNTTIDGKTGYPGSIYTERYNSTAFTDPVTVVYGHNMKEGTMFSQLRNYTDKAFFDSNPYIYVYLPDKTLKYQIFAAVAFDDRYILGSYNFDDKNDFQKYLDELRSTMDGNVNPDVQVTQDSKILTLSTCIDEYPEQRWLVNATLVSQEQ